jgi:hypothetical protein
MQTVEKHGNSGMCDTADNSCIEVQEAIIKRWLWMMQATAV